MKIVANLFSLFGMLIALASAGYFMEQAIVTYSNPNEYDLWPMAAVLAVGSLVLFAANLFMFLMAKASDET